MERVKSKEISVKKALSRLESSLADAINPDYINISDKLRDSAIQRFEFSIDTFCKYLKIYIIDRLNLAIEAINSPRSILKATQQANLINNSQFKICIQMIEDRNRTSHTYNEEIAAEIFERLPLYLETMLEIVSSLNN